MLSFWFPAEVCNLTGIDLATVSYCVPRNIIGSVDDPLFYTGGVYYYLATNKGKSYWLWNKGQTSILANIQMGLPRNLPGSVQDHIKHYVIGNLDNPRLT